jgi:hypothetical protein
VTSAEQLGDCWTGPFVTKRSALASTETRSARSRPVRMLAPPRRWKRSGVPSNMLALTNGKALLMPSCVESDRPVLSSNDFFE